MIASLPMYDWPEIREATDTFWNAIAGRLGFRMDLQRPADFHEPWHNPNLILSQICGYHMANAFHDVLTYVATPHYAVRGCSGPHYSSFVFARDPGKIASGTYVSVINNPDSMSGMLALKLAGYLRPGFVVSGAHVRSLEMVQNGMADVAAIDAVCVELARRHRPWLLEGLTEIAQSPLVPGLPYVTRAGDAAKLKDILTDAMSDPGLADQRAALLLGGISDIGAGAYDVIPKLEAQVSA